VPHSKQVMLYQWH